MIGDEVCMDTVVFENLRQRVVKGFDGPPATVGKSKSSGMHVTSSWHAWHAPYPGVIEGYRSLTETFKVWGMSPVASIIG